MAVVGLTELGPDKGCVFVVTLRPLQNVTDPIKALRGALKILLRRFGLRCVSVTEEKLKD
jgi:hypothetical protein